MNTSTSKSMSLSPAIAASLQKELKETFFAILENPSCGKTVAQVQAKHTAKAEAHFLLGHPKIVAKRLARNTIRDLIETVLTKQN